MRILLLADASSAHTIKWANFLAKNGIEIVIFSLVDCDKSQYLGNIIILNMNFSASIKSRTTFEFLKFVYIKVIFQLRKYIKCYSIDILHAHYASSYGLLGALSGFHPYIISAWGSDIFEFPQKMIFNKFILKFNLSKANKILATSEYLKKETEKYTDKEILITPFGIDTDVFKPISVKSEFPDGSIVIGVVKSLEKIYGIDYVIRAFKSVQKKCPQTNLKLFILGEGSEKQNLMSLVKNLGLENCTKFMGFIPPSEIPYYHNIIDIYIAFSFEESFGVSALEASSCCKPVIISDAGGFQEVVDDGVTGFVIKKGDLESLSDAMKTLVINKELRKIMGENGRQKVIKDYRMQECGSKMIKIYNEIN